MISRRTTLFLAIALVCFGILEYRTWEQELPCRDWKQLSRTAQLATYLLLANCITMHRVLKFGHWSWAMAFTARRPVPSDQFFPLPS